MQLDVNIVKITDGRKQEKKLGRYPRKSIYESVINNRDKDQQPQLRRKELPRLSCYKNNQRQPIQTVYLEIINHSKHQQYLILRDDEHEAIIGN